MTNPFDIIETRETVKVRRGSGWKSVERLTGFDVVDTRDGKIVAHFDLDQGRDAAQSAADKLWYEELQQSPVDMLDYAAELVDVADGVQTDDSTLQQQIDRAFAHILATQHYRIVGSVVHVPSHTDPATVYAVEDGACPCAARARCVHRIERRLILAALKKGNEVTA